MEMRLPEEGLFHTWDPHIHRDLAQSTCLAGQRQPHWAATATSSTEDLLKLAQTRPNRKNSCPWNAINPCLSWKCLSAWALAPSRLARYSLHAKKVSRCIMRRLMPLGLKWACSCRRNGSTSHSCQQALLKHRFAGFVDCVLPVVIVVVGRVGSLLFGRG